jgi:hypothetical protein
MGTWVMINENWYYGLYRRRHRQNHKRLARIPLGRIHAMELAPPHKWLGRKSSISCGLQAPLTMRVICVRLIAITAIRNRAPPSFIVQIPV